MIVSSTTKARKPKALSKLVFQQVRPYKNWLLLIFFAMVIEASMDVIAPWPLKIIIDNVIGHHPLPVWLHWINKFSVSENTIALAAAAAILLVIVTVIGAIAGYINSYFTESVAQYVANDVRLQVYHHLQRLSLEYYDTHQVGKILSTIITDVATMQDFVSTTLLRILVDAMIITGILGLMFYLHWAFALVAIAVTPFLVVFVFRFKKAVKKSVREVRKDESNMMSVLQQGLESIRVINAFGTQDTEEGRLRKVSLETVHAALKTRRLKALLSPVVNILVTLCIALVLWKGSTLVVAGVMTVGSLTVFLSYLTKFFSPVKDIAKMSNAVTQATVAVERIQQILETDDIIKQKTNPIVPGKFEGAIVFEDVQFGYDHHDSVLKNVNITIKAGERVGICGPTGGGKSTVASLIPRFYDLVGGRILIDGVDISDYSLDGLRKQIGFVLQDTVLFYGSIAENIAYGKPDASEAEIINAAKLANAEEFIAKMPGGYNTLVGERGLTLSGGQRQRIGIARAIIRDSPILILDEPTAALDTESEKIVMEALEKLMKGRTVITIAHRLSTIYNSDKIIVIKDGRVSEEGTHEELIAQGALYAELFHGQANASVSHVNKINFIPEANS
jgi:ABC-type multidrug transport system fused ATPase/permease subunit